MRIFKSLAAVALVLAPVTAYAAPAYTTGETELGTLLDNPATNAVLVKHLPALVENPMIAQVRSLNLKALQQFKPDMITDELLAKIDTDLAALPAKK